MVKRLVDHTQHENVCFIGDDTLPNPGFLKHALDDMARLPDGWGLVGLNDRTGRDLATHWVASKKLLPLIGGEFFHTGYWHCFCDVELQERCAFMGRYIYSRRAVVIHDHPWIKQQPIEGDYKRVYSKEWLDHDRALFLGRREMWLHEN
jgi:hypothetical protein